LEGREIDKRCLNIDQELKIAKTSNAFAAKAKTVSWIFLFVLQSRTQGLLSHSLVKLNKHYKSSYSLPTKDEAFVQQRKRN